MESDPSSLDSECIAIVSVSAASARLRRIACAED